MPDFEHPSPIYVKWAEAIEDTVSKLFSDTRKEKLVLSGDTDMTHLNVERAVSDLNDPRAVSASGNGLKSPPGLIDSTPSTYICTSIIGELLLSFALSVLYFILVFI